MIFCIEVNSSFAIIVLIADSFDVSADIHVDANFSFFRLNCLKKVGENDFCDCFVEDFFVSEGVNIYFE